MDKMTEGIANQQQEGLDALVQQFMKQMQNSMNADFSSLGIALQEMVASNDRFQHSMSQLIDHMQKATQIRAPLPNKCKMHLPTQLSRSPKCKVRSVVSLQCRRTFKKRSDAKILERQMQASDQQQSTIGNMMTGMNDQANQMLANQEEISRRGCDYRKVQFSCRSIEKPNRLAQPS